MHALKDILLCNTLEDILLCSFYRLRIFEKKAFFYTREDKIISYNIVHICMLTK